MELSKMDFTINSINEPSRFDSVESLVKSILYLDSDLDITDIKESLNGDQYLFDGDLELSNLFLNKDVISRAEDPKIGFNNWKLLLDLEVSNIEVLSWDCSDNDENETNRNFVLYEFYIGNNKFTYLQWDI